MRDKVLLKAGGCGDKLGGTLTLSITTKVCLSELLREKMSRREIESCPVQWKLQETNSGPMSSRLQCEQ